MAMKWGVRLAVSKVAMSMSISIHPPTFVSPGINHRPPHFPSQQSAALAHFIRPPCVCQYTGWWFCKFMWFPLMQSAWIWACFWTKRIVLVSFISLCYCLVQPTFHVIFCSILLQFLWTIFHCCLLVLEKQRVLVRSFTAFLSLQYQVETTESRLPTLCSQKLSRAFLSQNLRKLNLDFL